MFLCSSFSYYYEVSEWSPNGQRIHCASTWPGPLGFLLKLLLIINTFFTVKIEKLYWKNRQLI